MTTETNLAHTSRLYDSASPPLVPFSAARGDLAEGRDSPRALLERCIQTIEGRDASVQAFVVTDLPAARAAADAATARWKESRPLSPVDGMPIGIKDIIETRDLPTAMNNPIYHGWDARRDAACVLALRHAGAVFVGKTVTAEFACGESGPTTNPHDAARTPGGSSRGSAAAVGAGMVSAALATQTQASTIRPASYCGAYGFKPSLHALHIGGINPLAPTQDHLGIIAASLADAWAVARVISGGVGGMPPHPGLQGPMELPEPRRPGAVIGLRTRGWSETDDESKAAYDDALARLGAAGVTILTPENDPDADALETELADANEVSMDIFAYEIAWPLRAYLGQGEERVGTRIRELIEHGGRMSRADYQRALGRRDALRTRVNACASRVDGFVALASSGPAIEGHAYSGSRSYALPWTMVAGPSLSLPLLSAADLPLGLQVMGYRDRDAEAVAVAAWIERALRG